MNEPTDIKALDEYLKGGSEISQRYRELGREDVPPELDRRVLEEAHAAVANAGARRAKSLLRWSAPVALAASVVLVVTVVIENGVPKDTAYVVQPALEETRLYDEQPAQDRQFVPEAPAAPPAAAPVPPAELASERSVAKAEAGNERLSGLHGEVPVHEEVKVAAKVRRDQEQSSPVVSAVAVDAAEQQLAAQNAASPPAVLERSEAEADSDAGSVSVSGSRVRRATGRTAGPRNTISGVSLRGEMRQSADASAGAAASAEQPQPEKWLEDIRELRRKGKIADADREWLRFTEAYPDFEVADDDIARKH